MALQLNPGMEKELAFLRSTIEQRPLTEAHLLEVAQRIVALTASAMGRPERGWELAKKLPGLIAGDFAIRAAESVAAGSAEVLVRPAGVGAHRGAVI